MNVQLEILKTPYSSQTNVKSEKDWQILFKLDSLNSGPLRGQYSAGIFHETTKEEVFSKDLKCRCSMIVTKRMEKYDKIID